MLKVIQWATGPVGRYAIAAVVDHPELELVGARVYTDEKVGQDVGEIASIGPIGVAATNDTDEILAMDADCVIYMAMSEANPMAAVEDICAILASGKNVVSTSITPMINPVVMGPEILGMIEKACADGGSSFHGTGIQPGWAAEVLPLTMSGVFRFIDHLTVQELLDYSTYDHAFNLFDGMGFGRAPDDDTVLWGQPEVIGGFFVASIMLIAEGLEAEIDDIVYDRQTWVTDEAFDIPAGHIAAGTVAAMRFSATAIIEGRPALTIEHVTRVRDEAAPDWPSGQGWRVTVEGLPSMILEAKIGKNGEDHNAQACLGTAMHAVHAVVPVCNAEPGIRRFLELPTIFGRHSLTKPVHDNSGA